MQRIIFCPALFFFFFFSGSLFSLVLPGIDILAEPENIGKLKGKKIALIANQTSISSKRIPTFDLLKSKSGDFKIVKIFAPEHGFKGEGWASEAIENTHHSSGIPILSLHGKTRRPTPDMLKDVDAILFDIQDIGSRSYTFSTTLFYVMEEAAKHNIKVFVLDRPNPINGVVVDGPMMEEKFRSFVGYLNVPYCHGMTIGELASFFNSEYKIGCDLEVIPMKGWKRIMTFRDTGLLWVPTSPNIPEADTPFYYPITGIVGELGLVSIGIGYTLPFKLIGAPWIDGEKLSKYLNKRGLPGVYFSPIYFRPFSGKWANQTSQGVLIHVQNHLLFKPVQVQYAIIDAIKKNYPKTFRESLKKTKSFAMFDKVNGTDKISELMSKKDGFLSKYPMNLSEFLEKRKKYLLY